MKTVLSLCLIATTLALLCAPVLVSAQALTNIVPCGNGTGTQIGTSFDSNSPDSNAGCNFAALYVLIKNITNLLIIVSAPIFVGILVWSGIMLLRYAYSPEKLSGVKKVLTATVISFLLILAAWLIVHIIASVFFQTSYNIFNI